MRTRRDRDLRLGYTGVAVGAAAFVAALVVTTTVVDVLPDLGTGDVVSSAEQRVLPGVRVRPQPRTTLAPAVPPAQGRSVGSGAAAPSAPAVPDAPGPGPSAPGAAPGAEPGAGPVQPPAAPGPGKPSEPEPDGPVSSVLTPVATTVVGTLDAASGGATQPVGQAALGLVGAVGDLVDGPLTTQRR
ncbi:hypothetical protein I601_3988 [Nocardioides dokdonensis FR1436]|uniref:Uncharacterized protein n=1 Tax=Nocardioides dokdonensis FR1436 TaxID=1300347 RepID=A0A1A9GSD8_9ACTN|nr:hypothetical protein I601_3988 [Nocardioides dokdonensis FR1436]